MVVPFIAVFGLSYFFVQFGPNMTTFVLPSEVFPVSMRTTGHGIAAGIGKLGAFIGVFLVPQLQNDIGLRGMLLVAGGAAILGFCLTRLLPEPARRTLEELSGEETGAIFPALQAEGTRGGVVGFPVVSRGTQDELASPLLRT
jgi:PHS family inorganic phosphate transporter-like MFS transporter